MRAQTENRLEPGDYADRTVTKAPPWHGLVAWDMLFNSLTTGTFLTAAIGDLVSPADFAAVARLAYPLALVLLLIDLACLIGDLGAPMRFHYMLRVFKRGSPMSLGTWCLTIYSFPLTVAAAISLLDWPLFAAVRNLASADLLAWLGPARTLAIVAALVPAFGSAVYKGVLISTSAQPGWKAARWLGAYMTSAAPMLGCAVLLIIAGSMNLERAAGTLRTCLMPLILLNLIVLALLVGNLRPALERRWTCEKNLSIGAAAFGGLVVPMVLMPFTTDLITEMALVALLLGGSLLVRFVIVLLPHEVARGDSYR
jgi:hypothetical protein